MWFYLFTTAFLLVVFLLKRHFEYWQRRNVPSEGFSNFIKGLWLLLLRKKAVGETIIDVYRKYKDYPFVGIYPGGVPALLVRDPDLLKHIYSTNFKSFEDNGVTIDKKMDPILGRNPFMLHGEEWKTTRTRLTPGFTSGKMKFIFPGINNVAEYFVNYLVKNPKDMNAKDIFTRFTLDSVASSAFGLEAKSFESDDCDFMKIANGFLGNENQTLLTTVAFMAPWIFKFFPTTKLVPKQVDDDLTNIVTSTIDYRKQNNVTRNDFLQFLIQQNETIPDFKKVDVVAAGATFLLDGYETSSIVLALLIYEIASHLDVQEKLRKEIEDTIKKFDGEITYECIQEMQYLDACIYESLRKNAVGPVIRKRCTKKFRYTTESDQFKKMTVEIERGMTIFVPLAGLQTDERYFDNPLEYRPERMLNREEYNKYAFMPFGAGQRTCLGQRFGLLQIQIVVTHLVRNFKISLNKNTVLPLKFEPWYFLSLPRNPVYVDFEKI